MLAVPVEQVHTPEASTREPKGKQHEEPIFIPKGMLLRVLSDDRGEWWFGFVPGKSSAFPVKPVKQRSYAYAAKKAPPKAPANRVKPVPAAAPPPTTPAAQASSRRHRKPAIRPDFTAEGPSRRQLLVFLGTSTVPVFDASELAHLISAALRRAQSSLLALSVSRAYSGLSIATNNVPTPAETDIVRDVLSRRFGPKSAPNLSVGPPESTSYLRIPGVPFFMDGVDGMKVPLTTSQVGFWLNRNPMLVNVRPAREPRIVRETRTSTFCSIYLDIWDSKSGRKAREILAHNTVSINGVTTRVQPAEIRRGVPLCERCWRWGHPDSACHARKRTCPICAGPHSREEHREHAPCCKGSEHAQPPIAPTPAGVECPHDPHCVNCRGLHPADHRACPFWRKRFDREWIDARYSEVRAHVRSASIPTNRRLG